MRGGGGGGWRDGGVLPRIRLVKRPRNVGMFLALFSRVTSFCYLTLIAFAMVLFERGILLKLGPVG